jgi:hypothetical protein
MKLGEWQFYIYFNVEIHSMVIKFLFAVLLAILICKKRPNKINLIFTQLLKPTDRPTGCHSGLNHWKVRFIGKLQYY